MKIDLINKDFYYQDLVIYIYLEITNNNFLYDKRKKLDLGHIKWIYEKEESLKAASIFFEDNFFRVVIEKHRGVSFGKSFVSGRISEDIYNFKIIHIDIYIESGVPDYFNIKRQLLNCITRKVHFLTLEAPFLRKNCNQLIKSSYFNFTKEEALSFNLGIRAESSFFGLNFKKCMDDFISILKISYEIKSEDYNILRSEILNNYF